MNKKPYGSRAITAYLLGSLSADEAEQFDELSFTDEEFAAQLQAAENDLVDAYVNGELAGAELEQFETYYLASPLRRGRTDFAQAFQKFAGTHAAERPVVANLDAGRKIGGFFSNLFAFPLSTAQWGFGFATLLLVVFAGWLLVENSRRTNEVDQAQQRGTQQRNAVENKGNTETVREPEVAQAPIAVPGPDREQEQATRPPAVTQPEPPSGAQQKQPQEPRTPNRPPVTIASFVLAPQLRGAVQMQTLTIPAKTEWVDLRLELEPNEIPAFRVSLADRPAGRATWRSGSIKAKGTGENRSLNIRIPARLLKSGQVYTLDVSSDADANETFSNYSFKAVVK